jgi:rhamnulokinase
MGVELEQANCCEESFVAGFTNEGGYGGKYRFLKNIMGLWMIQSVRQEYGKIYSFAQLCAMAEEEKDFVSRVNVNDDAFFAPNSMIGAVCGYCEKTQQPVPATPAQVAAVIYQSLAECYGQTIGQIESITGKAYDAISIIGGGSNADYLNQLTANVTGKIVYAGPTEATAIGNVAAQMLELKAFQSVAQARNCIFDSFAVKTFLPE